MKKIETIKESLEKNGYVAIKYSAKKDLIMSSTNVERDSNNSFIKDITAGVLLLSKKSLKITPNNLSKVTNYSTREIGLNLYEIVQVMNALGIE